MRLLCLSGSIGILVLASSILLAHPGRTDSSGGHHDRKNGGYHYHNSGAQAPSSPPVNWSLPSPIERSRTTARTEARTQARTVPRERTLASAFKHTVKHEDSVWRESQTPPEKEKRLLAKPQFILFFSGGRILELVSFTKTSDGYEIIATHGGKAFYPNEIVSRIEPIGQLRVWKDISGRFQIEAMYVDVVNNEVRLKKKDGTVINVSILLLSKDDRTLVDAIQASSQNRS